MPISPLVKFRGFLTLILFLKSFRGTLPSSQLIHEIHSKRPTNRFRSSRGSLIFIVGCWAPPSTTSSQYIASLLSMLRSAKSQFHMVADMYIRWHVPQGDELNKFSRTFWADTDRQHRKEIMKTDDEKNSLHLPLLLLLLCKQQTRLVSHQLWFTFLVSATWEDLERYL